MEANMDKKRLYGYTISDLATGFVAAKKCKESL